MIFAKTVCRKPGSYVSVVPVGLRISLQYNQDGLLQAAKVVDVDEDLINEELLNKMRKFVPQKIALTGGTTWVEGVFYFSDIPTDSGVVPECCYETYLARFNRDDCMCSFYAGNITSLAAAFNGVVAIRNWLSVNQFKMLPGLVIPADFNESSLEMLMQTGAYSFKYPYIAGFYVYNLNSVDYVPTDLHQGNIKVVENGLTPEGYVQSTVSLDEIEDDNIVKLVLNYSDVCTHSVQEGACILYYKGERISILATRSSSNKPLQVVDNKVTCPVCHKVYYAPAHGPVQCDDPHCLSTAYPDVCRMLRALELPELNIDDFSKLITSKKIVTFTDVLDVKPYKDTKVKADLVTILKAGVPVSVGYDDNFLEALVRYCQNNKDSLLYYVNNPNRIYTELDIADTYAVATKRFVEWCSDSYNVLTITSLISAVDLVASSYKFEGAPIFRGNTIALTGKFRRGEIEKIKTILEGYAAKVVMDFDKEAPTLLVTGGTNENIEGRLVQAARKLNVPVVDEDEFFDKYEIIADMMTTHLL